MRSVFPQPPERGEARPRLLTIIPIGHIQELRSFTKTIPPTNFK